MLCLIYWSSWISIGLCSISYNVQSFNFCPCLKGFLGKVCKEFSYNSSLSTVIVSAKSGAYKPCIFIPCHFSVLS